MNSTQLIKMASTVSLSSCLICGVDNCRNVFTGKCGNLMSSHLHVIFLLRNVLEVPVDKLIIYLESCPNLESWISVCDKCEGMVNRCKTIYEGILTAQREFRIVKQEIIESLKESPVVKLEEDEEEDDDVIDISLKMVEEIREFVYHNEYPETAIDPFISGDRLCRQKLSQLISDKARNDQDDNLFWTTSDIEIEDEENDEVEEKVVPFLVIKNSVPSTSTTTTTAANVAVTPPPLQDEGPLSLSIDDDDDDKDDDSVYLVDSEDDDENDEEFVDLEQEEKEELIMEPTENAINLQDPLSLPATIDLDSDTDKQDDDDDDDQIEKEDDEDFEPEDEDMDSDEDSEIDQMMEDNVSEASDDSSVTNDNQNKSEDEQVTNQTQPLQNEKPPNKKSSRLRSQLKSLGLPKPIPHPTDDTFSCPICHKTEPSYGHCSKHIQVLHHSRTKYLCNRCGSTTDNQAKLLLHQKICTGLSYLCPLAPQCLRRFFKVHSLRIHLRDTHGKDDQSNLPPKIQKLLKKMRESNSKICKTCGKEFATPSSCLRHREFIHEKKWKCGKCGDVKWSKGDLEKHQEICEEEKGSKKWKCPVKECEHIFKEFRALTIHIGSVHKEHGKIKMREEDRPVVICEWCGATFRRQFRLNSHYKYSATCRRIRGLEAPPRKEDREEVICEICGKSYPGRKVLGVHVRTVHERRFSKRCEICGKGFSGARNLRMHLWTGHRIGEGGGRWMCEVEGCGVVVKGEKMREEHMRRKHGERERRWGCGECGKRYLHERSLLQHRKEVHVEGRTYKKKRKSGNEEIINNGGGGDIIKL